MTDHAKMHPPPWGAGNGPLYMFTPTGELQSFQVRRVEKSEPHRSSLELTSHTQSISSRLPNALLTIADRITKHGYGVNVHSFTDNCRILNQTDGEESVIHLWDWFRTAMQEPSRLSWGVRDSPALDTQHALHTATTGQRTGSTGALGSSAQGSFLFPNYSHASHRDMCLNRLGFQQIGMSDEAASSDNVDLLLHQISRAVIHQQLEEATRRSEHLREFLPDFTAYLSLMLYSASQIISAVKSRSRTQASTALQLQSAGTAFYVAHKSVDNDEAWQSFASTTRGNLKCTLVFLVKMVQRMIDNTQDDELNSEEFEKMIADIVLKPGKENGSIQLRFSLALIWCKDVGSLHQDLWQICVDTGRMDGLCLKGLGASEATEEVVALVYNFVSSTGDIQSPALIYCHAIGLLQNEPRCLEPFFDAYSELLLRWKMVVERGQLHRLMGGDGRHEGGKKGVVPRGAVMSCYYCQIPLVGPIPRSSDQRPVTIDPDLETVLTRCPNSRCKKPVPACSVCLMPVYVVSHKTDQGEVGKLPVDDWLSWCQNCHHGGHMKHVMDWFDKFSMCPVADCDCECGSIAL